MSIATYPPPQVATGSTAQLAWVEIPGFTGITAQTTLATATVFVPANRRIKITAHIAFSSSVSGDTASARIFEDGVHIGQDRTAWTASNAWLHAVTVVTPSAGTHTYTVTVDRSTGTGTVTTIDGTGSNKASFLLIEDITGGAGGPGPIILADAQWVSNQAVASGGHVALPLSVTVAVPANRKIRVTGRTYVSNATSNARSALYIYEDGVQKQGGFVLHPSTAAATNTTVEAEVVLAPSAGVHTYELRGAASAGTSTFAGDTGHPASLEVEDITGTPSPAGILPTSQTLAYAQVTANQGSITTTNVDIAGLSATITVPEGRRIRISSRVYWTSTTSDGDAFTAILEGTTQLTETRGFVGGTTQPLEANPTVIVTPSAGTHTYKIVGRRITGSGTLTSNGHPGYPAFILIEDITGGAPAVAPSNVPVGLLGQAIKTGPNQTGIPGAWTAITGLSVNVAIPSGRTLRVRAHSHMQNTVVGGAGLRIRMDGTTTVDESYAYSTHAGSGFDVTAEGTISPSAGAHTFTVDGFALHGGTATQVSSTAYPAFLTVEDITPTPAPASTAPSSTLGYAQITATQAGIGTTEVDIAGLSVTVTVPGGRRIRIRGRALVGGFTSTAARANIRIREGSSYLQLDQAGPGIASNVNVPIYPELVLSPSAGTYTYRLTAAVSAGAGAFDVIADPAFPAYISVEDITGVSVDVHDHNSAPTSTLGYAEKVTNQTGIAASGSATFIDGLTTTVTVPAGRRLRLSAYSLLQKQTAVGNDYLYIYETTSGSVLLTEDLHRIETVGIIDTFNPSVVISPTAGTHTYSVAVRTSGGSIDVVASSGVPAYLLVEDISGHGIPGHTHPQLDGITDSGWITLPLINGWVSYDNTYGPPRYRKLNGIVYVQGLIRSGTLGVSCAQLPVGYRPSLPKLLFGTMRNANVEARIDVQSDGHIIMAIADAGWTTLSGITFPADQ